jgi:predicted DNA binding protein
MTQLTVLHPDQVLKALLDKGVRSDKEEKLHKLQELCAHEYGRYSSGARDFSISNMSRIAESHGLFKARTIYNKQSEDYAILIKAWEAYNGPVVAKPAKIAKGKIEKYEFLNKIDDPVVRNLCLMGLIQRDKFKAELDLLKSNTQITVDMRPLGAEITKGSMNVAVIETLAQLTDSERTALKTALDRNALEKRNWTIGVAGEVIDDRGRFIFQPGFVTALQKVLGFSLGKNTP